MLFGLSYFFIGPADFIGRPWVLIASNQSHLNRYSIILFSRQIWITCVAFGITGVGAAMGSIPIYADMLNISKYDFLASLPAF